MVSIAPIKSTPRSITTPSFSKNCCPIIGLKLGNFAIDLKEGPAAGKHRIEIESTDFGGLAMDDEDAINRLEMQRTKRVKVAQVPARYNRQSILAETLEASELNELRFELTSKRSR